MVAKKVVEKNEPQTVIVISSDDESENDKPHSRRISKSLTSTLTARSKVNFFVLCISFV